ncbi:MAG: hypothetical protein ACC618_04035 [Patescibacteria group bacterium]
MTEKVFGYLLLVIGLVVIVYSVFSVFNVFTGKSQAVDLFQLSGISLDLSSLVAGEIPSGGSTQAEIVPPELINKPLNVATHLFLMGFVASVGFKVASLGVMLVRPIKVKLKEDQSSNPKVPPR